MRRLQRAFAGQKFAAQTEHLDSGPARPDRRAASRRRRPSARSAPHGAWPAVASTLTSRASIAALSPSSRSKGLLAMPCATSQVSSTLIGHSSSSGASIQSRISPNSETCRATLASWCGSQATPVDDLFEAVTQPAHRRDAHRALLDLLAQSVDVDLDRVVADLFAPFAQAFDQLILADQPAGALQQHFEQAQFARRQLDHLIVHVGDPAGRVEAQRAVPDQRRRRCPVRAASARARGPRVPASENGLAM